MGPETGSEGTSDRHEIYRYLTKDKVTGKDRKKESQRMREK